MTKIVKVVWVALILAFVCGAAWANDDADTVKLFKNAGQSSAFFSKSYGYAVFPTMSGVGERHCVHLRQARIEHCPAVALIVADPYAAG